MQNRIVKFVGFIFLCSSLVGCFHKLSSHSKDMLRIDVGSEVPTLDPALGEDTSSTRVAFDLFEGVVSSDQKNKPIPGLARSWDVSPDKKTYTFYLRDNIKFSDGVPITASDFVYSYQRLINPKTASPYSFLLQNVVNGEQIIKGKMPPSSLGVFAPDAKTFVVKLAVADPNFIPGLTLPNTDVVPKHIIEKYGDKWTEVNHIVTSGAYVLKEHIVNGYMIAVKNPYYYDEKNVKIAKIKYYPYVDTNASVSSYKSGGLDITFQTVPVDQYRQIKSEYPTQLHTVTQEALYYYDLNMKLPVFANNPKLRQALSMAIDRQVLAKYVVGAGVVPLYSVVTPTVENGKYADMTYAWSRWSREHQIQQAIQLYKEAGYSIAKPLKISITYNTNDQHRKVALAVASMWKDVLGVEVTLQNQDWKTFIQDRHTGNYSVARDGWVADYDLVSSYTTLYLCGSPQNNSGWCNASYNKLINQAFLEKDPLEQTRLTKQALQVALDAYAVIPLFQYTYQRLVKPYVKNYQIDENHLDHVQSKWMHF